MIKIKTSLNTLLRTIEHDNRLPDHLFLIDFLKDDKRINNVGYKRLDTKANAAAKHQHEKQRDNITAL